MPRNMLAHAALDLNCAQCLDGSVSGLSAASTSYVAQISAAADIPINIEALAAQAVPQ